MFIQRLSSVKNEREAEKAVHAFNVLNYVVRSWPWILVALCALIILPKLEDPELAYPLLMKRYLPSGMLGLVFASLLAAFMSTVSTQVNWGASYIVNDIYARFSHRKDDAHLLRMARWASIGITVLAATVSFFMKNVGEVFTFLILVGNGPGLVLLLRWFWWRINAAAELAAMGAGILLAIATYVPGFPALNVGQRLLLTAFGSLAVWLPVMFLTKPEPAATLDAFYARVRPGGWWGPIQERTGLTPLDALGSDLLKWLFWVAIILGGTLAIGSVVLR
jgi:Na+/proline symporter